MIDPKTLKPLPVIGWRELVDLPRIGLTGIPAKIDTGARTSSLHARVLEQFDRQGKPFIRFAMDWDGAEHIAEAIQVDTRGVTSSNGDVQSRFVIKTPLRIGMETFRAEFTLADRTDMKFPMLIGRTALRRRFVVDSGHSWLQTPDEQLDAATAGERGGG